MLVDTHCHLNLKDYSADRRDVVRRAFDGGVKMIQVGVSVRTSQEVVALAQEYESGIWAAVGIHPTEVANIKGQIIDIAELAQESKVVAIGECGLDFYHLPKDSREARMHQQEMAFRAHIQLARDMALPLIVHCRDAYDETFSIMQDEQAPRGVIHCFTGTLDQAMRFIDHGFYISCTGIITFPNAKELQEVVRQLPLGRLLIETDSPYLAPSEHRGRRNEPVYVEHVARAIADLKGISYEDVARATTHNAHDLFGV